MLALLILSFALAMDAFAASLCQGAVAGDARGTAIRVGAAFGAAQGLMPLIGWSLGLAFAAIVQAVDHWIALVLLGLLGGKMLWEGFSKGADDCVAPMGAWALFVASVGTSIDAAAAGVTLPLLGQPVLLACAVIGATTAVLCFAGVWAGRSVGARLGRPAVLLGGAVLAGLGVKIFVEHQFLGG
jgi:manganese efflux pump family protein